jgi:hypothetical protein
MDPEPDPDPQHWKKHYQKLQKIKKIITTLIAIASVFLPWRWTSVGLHIIGYESPLPSWYMVRPEISWNIFIITHEKLAWLKAS